MVCNKAFIQKSKQVHKCLHSVERPCSCNVYNKTFFIMINLQHINAYIVVSALIKGGAKITHVLQIIVISFFFQYKKLSTPKQPLINALLNTYIDYSITEHYIGKMASYLPYARPEPLLKVLHHIY